MKLDGSHVDELCLTVDISDLQEQEDKRNALYARFRKEMLIFSNRYKRELIPKLFKDRNFCMYQDISVDENKSISISFNQSNSVERDKLSDDEYCNKDELLNFMVECTLQSLADPTFSY